MHLILYTVYAMSHVCVFIKREIRFFYISTKIKIVDSDLESLLQLCLLKGGVRDRTLATFHCI